MADEANPGANPGATPAATPAAGNDTKPQDKSEALYKAIQERPNRELWNQKDFANLRICAPGLELMTSLQKLVDRNLLQMMQIDGQGVCWKPRTKDQATKLSSMNKDEFMVYQAIEGAKDNGLWVKALKARTNLSQQTLNKCLKSLEQKRFIKSFTNVKFPTRKFYILHDLNPAEEVTGGPWHENGELDDGLIQVLSDLICNYVQERSWNIKSVKVANPVAKADISDPEKKKKMQQDIYNAGGGGHGKKMKPYTRRNIIAPKPATYEDYPRIGDIHAEIIARDVLNNKSLKVADLQPVLDSLVFGASLERMSVDSYRVCRPAIKLLPMTHFNPEQYPIQIPSKRYADDGTDIGFSGNGYTDSPCSGCPVFSLCEEGSPVSARNCEYYERWLRPEKYLGEDLEDEDHGYKYSKKKAKTDIAYDRDDDDK